MADDVSAAHAVGTIKLWTRDYKAWKNLPSNLPRGMDALDLRYEDVVEDLDGTLRTLVRHLQTRLQIPDSRAPDPTAISAKEFARDEANLVKREQHFRLWSLQLGQLVLQKRAIDARLEAL